MYLQENIIESLINICPFKAIKKLGDSIDITSACKMCKIYVKNFAGAISYEEDEIIDIDKSKDLKHFVIEPYTAVFEDLIERIKPSSILVGATNIGRFLAPRIVARFRTWLTIGLYNIRYERKHRFNG